jgi:shikimate kinase
MSEIKIIIEGKTAQGKTTIGCIIQKALLDAGIEVDYCEEQHETKNIENYFDNIDEIVCNIKNRSGLSVKIFEEHYY